MLRVVDNNILNFFIGLVPTIIMFLFELITTRRKTLPIMLIGLFLGSVLSVLIAGKFIYIVVAILAAIIIYLKLRDKYDEEYAYLDYSKGIISISKFINAFNLNKDKQKGIVIGTVLPVSYNDIKNNGKAIYLTEDALSRGSMVTGATGSGKGLEKSTLIPTIHGMKTVEDLQIGDIIFDKNGNQTTVTDKYCPMDPVQYEFTFSDGTTVKSTAGHLWEVIDLYDRQKRGHLQIDFSSIDLNKLKNNCHSNNIISKNEFILKYLDPERYNTWYNFLRTHCKELFKNNKQARYISCDHLIAYTKDKLTKLYANKKLLQNRLDRLTAFVNTTNFNYINRYEAEKLLLGHWWDIIKDSGIQLLDYNQVYAPEGLVCARLLELFNQVEEFNSLSKDKRPLKLVTSQDIYKKMSTSKIDRLRFAIKRPIASNYSSIPLPIKPYFLGAWLGDGTKRDPEICGVDLEIRERLNQDYPIVKTIVYEPRKKGYLPLTMWNFGPAVTKLLKDNNLICNKHIPEAYKVATINDKLELIAGLIDTDGYVNKNGICSIALINEQIIRSAREICCSLGFKCSPIKEKQGKYKDKNGNAVDCKIVYSFEFHPNIMLPLQISRKRNNLQNKLNLVEKGKIGQQVRHERFYITEIRELNENPKDYYCLAVDSPTHMFLCTESYIPTHNTTTLINIMTQGVQKNKPIFFFDFKGESDILDKLEELAQSAKIDYYEFSSRRIDFKYDPFINLNSTGKIQALMNSKAWSADGSDSYYKTALQALLQDLIPTYEEYREQNYDESNFIIGLSEYIRSEYKVAPNHKDGFGTLKSIIDLMVTSRIREMLEGENKVEFSFDSDKPCIVAFSFVSSNKDLANYICSFIFQDIMDRGTRKRYTNRPLLVIDEFGTLANSALIKDILEKGRSVGLQTIISLQDINQIVENISRDFAISILGTISTFIIHPGATQISAELMGSTYRYDSVEFDIMNLEMPQGGKPPTCAFISKIRVLNDRGAQEMHKMIPYSAKPINKQEEKQKINPNKMYKSTNLINYDEIMKGYEVKEETPIEDENS